MADSIKRPYDILNRDAHTAQTLNEEVSLDMVSFAVRGRGAVAKIDRQTYEVSTDTGRLFYHINPGTFYRVVVYATRGGTRTGETKFSFWRDLDAAKAEASRRVEQIRKRIEK